MSSEFFPQLLSIDSLQHWPLKHENIFHKASELFDLLNANLRQCTAFKCTSMPLH